MSSNIVHSAAFLTCLLILADIDAMKIIQKDGLVEYESNLNWRLLNDNMTLFVFAKVI